MDAPIGCSHPRVSAGRCEDCDECLHDVVLNGACYFCGATEIAVTVIPTEGPVVPADRLRRRR